MFDNIINPHFEARHARLLQRPHQIEIQTFESVFLNDGPDTVDVEGVPFSLACVVA
jgi:hypothetical protein